jgi:threonine/homoserine/homoserine lactone efflux protein
MHEKEFNRMIPFDSIAAFVIASALLSIAPGPDNIFVLVQSALYGKKTGLMVTLGLCTGLVVHTSVVAFGIAVIFQRSVIAFNILKIAGAFYLLYLAWQAFTAPAAHLNDYGLTRRSNRDFYIRGIIMNITNPKVSIFFLAFLPQFTSPEKGSPAIQIFILGTLFIVVAFVIFLAISVLAGTLGSRLKGSLKVQNWLNKLAGTVFAGLAIKLASTGAYTD